MKVKVVKWCRKKWNEHNLMYIYHKQCEIKQKFNETAETANFIDFQLILCGNGPFTLSKFLHTSPQNFANTSGIILWYDLRLWRSNKKQKKTKNTTLDRQIWKERENMWETSGKLESQMFDRPRRRGADPLSPVLPDARDRWGSGFIMLHINWFMTDSL